MAKGWVSLVAVLVIGAIESLAILHNIDGTALAASLAAIGGIAGYTARKG